MQAEMPIVEYNTCAKANKKLGEVVDRWMICAGYGGDSKISGCHGDSGGPLVCEDPKSGRWSLRGTVSWGDHYCNGGPTYSVFVRINSYVDWIKCKMTSQPLKPSKFIEYEMDKIYSKREWRSWTSFFAFVRTHTNLVRPVVQSHKFDCRLAAPTDFIRGISAGKLDSFRLYFVCVSNERGSLILDYF